MKKNVGRIFNNRIVEGNKNIISKGEGFVSKESAVFIRTNNGFEGENPEPPVPPEPTNRILYTATTQPTSTWITNNCSENNFDSNSGKGYLVLKDNVTSLDGEYIEEPEELEYTIFKDYSSEDWEDDNIKSIVIPSQITSIGECAFEYCSGLTSVTIPNSVTSIGDYVFSDCSGLTSVTIPNSVTSIGYSVFTGCTSLTSVTISNGVTSISGNTFAGCTGLTSIEIPSSVTSIGDGAFSRCTSLASLEIPSSVTSIGDYAFAGCTSLTSIEIPSGVISIGDSAFMNCERLASVICEATTPPTLHHNSFTDIATTSCTVPVGCVSTYQTSAWSFYNGGYFITFTEIK